MRAIAFLILSSLSYFIMKNRLLVSLWFEWNLFALAAIFFTTFLLAGCGAPRIETDFDEVLVPAQREKRGFWGFVGVDGEMKIEPSLPNPPSVMWQGWATVKEAGTGQGFHYVRRDQALTEATYVAAGPFNDGRALVVNEAFTLNLINEELEPVKSIEQAWLAKPMVEKRIAFKDASGNWGFLDEAGEVVISPQFLYAFSFRNGLAKVVTYAEGKVAQGLIDQTGQWVIGPDATFSYLGHHHEGFISFAKEEGWGFLNREGEIEIGPQAEWTSLSRYVNGYAAYAQNERWGLIDRNGEKVFTHKFTHPPMFFDGDIALQHDGRSLREARPAIVTLRGELRLTEVRSGWPLTPMINGHGFVTGNGHAVWVNEKGEIDPEVSYESVSKDFYLNLSRYGFAFHPDEPICATSPALVESLPKTLVRIEEGAWAIGGLVPEQGVAAARWRGATDTEPEVNHTGYISLNLTEESLGAAYPVKINAILHLNRDQTTIREVTVEVALTGDRDEQAFREALIEAIAALPGVSQTSSRSYEIFSLANPEAGSLRVRNRSYGKRIELEWKPAHEN